MDIMRPKLTRIGNMCFRRLDIPNDGLIEEYDHNSQVITSREPTPDLIQPNADNRSQAPSVDSSKPSIDALEVMDDEEVDDGIEESAGKAKVVVNIPKVFHKFIIGGNGFVKNRIQSQSDTFIVIPDRNSTSVEVVITGKDRYDVRKAKNIIDGIVNDSRKKCSISHFVSIPMIEESIVNQFSKFKSEVLNDNQTNRGIEESLFQNKYRLHVTVVPLLLVDKDEETMASKILDKSLQDVIKPLTAGQTIRVRLQGLDIMNDDPTEAHVLFAKVVDVSDKQCLQSVVDGIFMAFDGTGLINGSAVDFDRVNAETKVKLHVTLMNTRYRDRDNSSARNQRNRRPIRRPFDASHILKQFGDYCFGEIHVKGFELSIIGPKNGKNGFYSHTSRIEL